MYLTHYLLLSLIRLDKAPTLYSPMGLSLVLVNYVITVALTVMAIVMMSQNAVLRFISVSYTHLDVYKRQPQGQGVG